MKSYKNPWWGRTADSRARICKRLRSSGIASNESIPPGWESMRGLLKRFTNSGSGWWVQVSKRILGKTKQRRRFKNEKDVSNIKLFSSLNLLKRLKELSTDDTECRYKTAEIPWIVSYIVNTAGKVTAEAGGAGEAEKGEQATHWRVSHMRVVHSDFFCKETMYLSCQSVIVTSLLVMPVLWFLEMSGFPPPPLPWNLPYQRGSLPT